MKLKILNLGECKGIDYFSYIDYPLTLEENRDIWVIIGKVIDDHFCIGMDKNIDDYLEDDVDKTLYTFSRYVDKGGLMWYKNNMLVRVIFPPLELNHINIANSVIARLMYILKFVLGENVELIRNMIYINGKDIGGYWVLPIKDNISIGLYINLSDIPSNVIDSYKTEESRFDNIGFLNSDILFEDLSKQFIDGLSDRWNVDTEYISINSIDISNLKKINNSRDWMESSKRVDLGIL